jgi:hypothetical protein
MRVDTIKPVRALETEALIACSVTSSDPYLAETGKRLAEAQAKVRASMPWRAFQSHIDDGWMIAADGFDNRVVASGLDPETAHKLVAAHNGVPSPS